MLSDLAGDPSLPGDLRESFATAHMHWQGVNLLTTREENERHDLAINQQVMQDMYREIVARIAVLPNLARTLEKHRKTPKIRFLHRDHEFGLDLTFRTPKPADGEDPPALLWFMTPTSGEFVDESVWQTTEGAHLMCHSSSTFHSLLRYLDQRNDGLDPQAALKATAVLRDNHPRHDFAPLIVDARCACGATTRNLEWVKVIREIEKTLDPARPRIDNGTYVVRVML